MRRLAVLLLCSLLGLLTPALPATAGAFPTTLPLPAGFYPEGIARGTGTTFYVGSLYGGGVYAGDLRTGVGSVVVPSVEGRVVGGLAFDPRSRLLWGVGFEGAQPTVFAFDPAAGTLVHATSVQGGLPNDLTVTRTAVYVTDSFSDVFWRLPLSARGLPSGPAAAVPLSGDFKLVTTGDFPVNLNGITATPDGRWLLAVHFRLGVLYRIDPTSGHATQLDLGGASLDYGDGIVLRGTELFVVQNFLQQVAVVALAPDLASGRVTELLTSDLMRVPTTGALFGSSLYLVNARFDVAFPPFFGAEPVTIDYEVVRVRV